jgi:flagellar hook-associated protein 2
MSTTSSLNLSTASSGSGIDVTAVVDAMIQAESAPAQVWRTELSTLQSQQTALSSLQTALGSMETSTSSLSDVLGVFSRNLAASSDESILTASADSRATAATHNIQVAALATRASFYSNSFASSTTPISSGAFTLQVGTGEPQSITIDSTNNTLDKLAAYLNSLGLNLQATIVTDANGARLAIAGTQTGKANDVQLSNVSGFQFTASSSAANAKLTVDGVPVESASNTVTGAIPGVTLNLANISQANGVTLSVSADSARVTQAVQNFVTNYNSLITSLNSQFAYDAANQTSGVLAGDSTVRGLQEALLGAIGYSRNNSDAVASLAQLGIGMQNDGTLTFDSSTFASLLRSNYDGVRTFFQGTTGDGTDGFANTVKNLIDRYSDISTGAIVLDLKGNSDSQKTINDQLDDFNVRIEARRQQLLNQYSQVDALLRQFPLQQNEITSELNSLNLTKSS